MIKSKQIYTLVVFDTNSFQITYSQHSGFLFLIGCDRRRSFLWGTTYGVVTLTVTETET